MLISAQGCDVDRRVIVASLHCKTVIVVPAVLVAATIVSTPARVRRLCDCKSRALTFTEVCTQAIAVIMGDIVWQSMDKFFYMMLGVLAATMTTVGLTGPLVLPTQAASFLVAIQYMARVMPILEHGF